VPVTSERTAEVPVRAHGVELIGAMRGSGYREPPALVRRVDGQTLQLTPLLYLVLEETDGRSTLADIAERVSQRFGRRVAPDDIAGLIDSSLRPLGLLTKADGSEPELKKADPLLGMRLRREITNPDTTRKLTAPFARLFHPLVVIPVICLFFATSWWLLATKGLAAATYHAFSDPGILLLVVAVTLLSAGIHEFGHAAAARYGGATPGRMGFGLYLMWPAFFTDVTDSYRLGRVGRLRTDLGGLYFNAIVAVLMVGIWWITQFDALLLIVFTQLLQMVRQLVPMVRFDGYHVLADLTGVPDLFARIGPALLSLLPWRWGHPESRVLKPWARAVVSAWVLVVVPMLIFSLVMMAISLPRVLATAWAGLERRSVALSAEWVRGDAAAVCAQVILIVATLLPIAAMLYILVRLVKTTAGATWVRTRGRPVARSAAGIVALGMIAGLAFAWWPNPQTYRPIQPYERGAVEDGFAAVGFHTAQFEQGSEGSVNTVWPSGVARPTQDHPQLAMVLVPKSGSASSAPSWVFPFSKPLPPNAGDNQALAVNTKNGSTLYDVAFALVWVDNAPVKNVNSAYAFANCSDCTTVAVGFQVVLVLGQSHYAVPQNLSVAANDNCVRCVTDAVANQLVLTLNGPLSPPDMTSLTQLWRKIIAFSHNLGGLSFSQIESQLAAYEDQIVALIKNDPSASPGIASTSTSRPTSGATSAPTATASPAPIPSSGPGAAPGSSTQDSGSTNAPAPGNASPPASPSPSPTATPTPVPTPTPTPTP
jgi:putative peptide zinc metalloprotease protein